MRSRRRGTAPTTLQGMSRRTLYLGLALLLTGAAVLWALRSPEDAQPSAGAPDGTRASAASASLPEPQPAPDPGNADADAPGSPEAASRRPTLGVPGGAGPGFLVAERPPSVPARIWRLQQEGEREIWDRHLGPLLYPEGHPLEGTWRDNVTLEQAVEAQVGYMGERWYPGLDLDEEKLYIERRVPFSILQKRTETWDRDDVQSSREFYEWLAEQPEDPHAYPTKVFLVADPNDPDTTTRAEHIAARIRETERANFPDDTP